jgi:hypothetical protein
MKKNIKYLALLILPILFVSCLVDDEFDNANAETTRIVGFAESTVTESYFEDLGAVTSEYAVVIIGGEDGLDNESGITVSYTVNTELSTAVEGLEFDFSDNSGSLTIPAGQSNVLFPLTVNTGSLNPEIPTNLILDLTSVTTNNGVVSQLNDRLEIIFVGCNSTIDVVEYEVLTTRDDGATEDHGTMTIVKTETNKFITTGFGLWEDGTIADAHISEIEDLCGNITVPLQGLFNTYSNEVTGVPTAELDGEHGKVYENGDIEINYKIGFSAGDRIYNTYYTKKN